jgi:hypothetical protein
VGEGDVGLHARGADGLQIRVVVRDRHRVRVCAELLDARRALRCAVAALSCAPRCSADFRQQKSQAQLRRRAVKNAIVARGNVCVAAAG